MRFSSTVFIFLFYFSSMSFSQEAKNLDFFGESAIQYREDRLRERVNENETNITNLSIVGQKSFDDNKIIRVEILGEESQMTQEFNLTIGELFYKQDLEFDNQKYLNFNYKIGFMKLNYWLLNPIDGNFAQLPNYYQFLFGLPRGIDVGLAVEKRITDKLFLGLGGYFGQTVRDSDGFQPESVGLPYNAYLKYKPFEWIELNGHYYSREFENTPEINGIGFDIQTTFRAGLFDIFLNAETWSITSNENISDSNGLVFLLNPKIRFKAIYVEGFYTDESWEFSGDPRLVSENFISHRIGFDFSKYFIFEAEYLSVENSELRNNKEDALQARVYFNWEM